MECGYIMQCVRVEWCISLAQRHTTLQHMYGVYNTCHRLGVVMKVDAPDLFISPGIRVVSHEAHGHHHHRRHERSPTCQKEREFLKFSKVSQDIVYAFKVHALRFILLHGSGTPDTRSGTVLTHCSSTVHSGASSRECQAKQFNVMGELRELSFL